MMNCTCIELLLKKNKYVGLHKINLLAFSFFMALAQGNWLLVFLFILNRI